jgi:hypothetical protein
MSNPIIRIHDLSTNEVIDREMTNEEVEQANYVSPKLAQERADEAKVYAAKEAQRQAILTRLGLTEEEARILLGGN